MAELTDPIPAPTSSCCAPETQTSCCERSEQQACCDTAATGGSCGCGAGEAVETDIRETVRAKYAAAARQPRDAGASCCEHADVGSQVFGATLYVDEAAHAEQAVKASLGCRVPTAVADLHEGETVLDLGSGAGADVLISARRVGGRARRSDAT